MQNLTVLDVQNNRLSRITGLSDLPSLNELYLAANQIQAVRFGDLPSVATLTTIDFSNNSLSVLEGIVTQSNLEELWMSNSNIVTFDELMPLQSLTQLSCIYLEFSPIAKDFEYRMKITQMFPSLSQLDALPTARRK